MDVINIKTKIARLERELEENRDRLRQATHDPEVFTAELIRTRAYAFDATDPVNEVVKGSIDSLSKYGFCVIDNVIPPNQVGDIREEVVAAQKIIDRNVQAIRALVAEGSTESTQIDREKAENEVELRQVRRVGHPPKPPNDIVWMPKYAQHLGNLNLVKVASKLLDDHLRIVQLHPKVIPVSNPKDASDISLGNDMLGLPRIYKGPESARDWHTDWPHDPSAYGSDNPDENLGCIRQPFPDITMGLTMIWYLTDINEKSGNDNLFSNENIR